MKLLNNTSLLFLATAVLSTIALPTIASVAVKPIAVVNELEGPVEQISNMSQSFNGTQGAGNTSTTLDSGLGFNSSLTFGHAPIVTDLHKDVPEEDCDDENALEDSSTGWGHGPHTHNVNDEKTLACGKTPMKHDSSKNETVRDSTNHGAVNDQEDEDCDDGMGSSDPGSLGNSSLPNGSDSPDSDDPLLLKPSNGTNATFAPISVYTALGTSNGIMTSPSVSVQSSRSTSTVLLTVTLSTPTGLPPVARSANSTESTTSDASNFSGQNMFTLLATTAAFMLITQ
ncbi:unnamed protein product [Umbelopsis vinacea]